MKQSIKIIILFIVIALIIKFAPGINNDYIKSSKLYISEIMASNSYTLEDEDGDYSDYIEIYNGYNYEVNLEGYYLSDDEFEPKKWIFPEIIIKPKEYLLIFASGKDKNYHTNFKLNSEREVVVLTDNTGNIISKISYQNMQNDISYGYVKGKYIYTSNPTPKDKNSDVKLKQNNSNYNIIINEYMTSNKRTNYSPDGYYYDWVELYNNSSKDIELNNLYLTDNSNILNKYKLPNIKIKNNEYIIIYLSGESKTIDDTIYANFKLSKDEELIISDGKKIIDKVKIIDLPDDISYGKKQDTWYYFTSPTPGKVNNTASFTSLGGQNERT